MIYKQGFDFGFDENACASCGGKCCTGASGNIFVSEAELEALRKHFKLDKEKFASLYLKKVGLRYSFKEYKFEDGYACIFFDSKQRNCSIYEWRPKQCKSFPFWDFFKKRKEELEKECIGVCF